MTQEEQREKLRLIDKAFSPSRPINEIDFFFGRSNIIDALARNISDKGKSIAIYGERGVGKTSLANILNSRLGGAYVSKVICEPESKMENLIYDCLANITVRTFEKKIGLVKSEKIAYKTIAELVGGKKITASTLQAISDSLKFPVVLVFDEFDVLRSKHERDKFAYFIKSLSDISTSVTFIVVGVANDVSELFEAHQSITRCLATIQVPPMDAEELEAIVRSGADILGLKIPEEILREIVSLSSGYPHYCHLIAKHTCRCAIENLRKTVVKSDLNDAISLSLGECSNELHNSYKKATIARSYRSNFKDVLYAVAQSVPDEYNLINQTEILANFNRIKKRNGPLSSINQNLQALTTIQRGQILKKEKEGTSVRYKFVNPFMQAFIKMQMTQDAAIKNN